MAALTNAVDSAYDRYLKDFEEKGTHYNGLQSLGFILGCILKEVITIRFLLEQNFSESSEPAPPEKSEPSL